MIDRELTADEQEQRADMLRQIIVGLDLYSEPWVQDAEAPNCDVRQYTVCDHGSFDADLAYDLQDMGELDGIHLYSGFTAPMRVYAVQYRDHVTGTPCGTEFDAHGAAIS